MCPSGNNGTGPRIEAVIALGRRATDPEPQPKEQDFRFGRGGRIMSLPARSSLETSAGCIRDRSSLALRSASRTNVQTIYISLPIRFDISVVLLCHTDPFAASLRPSAKTLPIYSGRKGAAGSYPTAWSM
jgi:hypothetical protein